MGSARGAAGGETHSHGEQQFRGGPAGGANLTGGRDCRRHVQVETRHPHFGAGSSFGSRYGALDAGRRVGGLGACEAAVAIIVAHCCHHCKRLVEQPWRIMSIGMREWTRG